jgi:hypothetical protein
MESLRRRGGEKTVTAERVTSPAMPFQKRTLTFAELRQAGGLLRTTHRPQSLVDAHKERHSVRGGVLQSVV